jgi:hypothetical protein
MFNIILQYNEQMATNYYLELLENLYVKKAEVDTKLAAISKTGIAKTVVKKNTDNGTTIEYSWNYSGLNLASSKQVTPHNGILVKRLVFTIPAICDELTGQDLSRLNNNSFIHSILYTIDPDYYSGLIDQKRADCTEFIEMLRKDFYIKEKLSKEATSILQNLENNTYNDITIQHIVNFLNSFHLIILNSDASEPPKLFMCGFTGKKGCENSYKSASSLVILYFDHNREVYYPAFYDPEDVRENMYILWNEPEFLQFIKNVKLWGKPSETKKWAVADLREWITFFGLSIDISLDKKAILEVLPNVIS